MTPRLNALLASLDSDLQRIAEARHHHPGAILGRHEFRGEDIVIVYLPDTASVRLDNRHDVGRMGATDFFVWSGRRGDLPQHYLVGWTDGHGGSGEFYDPYSFAPVPDSDGVARFAGGASIDAWRMLGAHITVIDGVWGVLFTVWAPNAERVSVVGNFNRWDGRRHPLDVHGSSGLWTLFVPGLAGGTVYKYEIRNRDNGTVHLKTDPYGRQFEVRPGNAALVVAPVQYRWGDHDWLARRQHHDWLHAPMSVYEVHLGSWRRTNDGGFLNYRELAQELVPYVKRLGFTHVELLPITEHPLDDSWGYQATGYFAATSRHGSPDDLRHFVDQCHQNGIGVLLDWVPAHFPRDAHALANFDGGALYEYSDPRKAEHPDWGTLVFDYARREVRSFLVSSACFWLGEFHFDGLRVDAVASMLYLDFSKRGETFVPNEHGGNQNLEAIEFLRLLNGITHERFPGTVTVAEESSEWPLVSRPVSDGGLGFSMKWNMGWMHDTLKYFTEDPLYRTHHHDKLTFGLMYTYSENFVLPFSHDEVVHLKRSLLAKMPGDSWQQFANLRLLLAYQWTYPAKKLLFMGGEFGQTTEWNFRVSLPRYLETEAPHAGVQKLVGDLNRLYAGSAALHRLEFEPEGFRWIDCDDRANSVICYERRAGEEVYVVVLNFTPVPRHGYRIGVPKGGRYREILNTDSEYYGGSNLGNLAEIEASGEPLMGRPCSLSLTLPPLAAVILKPI
ncbi:MAG TPA: 1,4-alpha-glucan branching protein GlgB [Steroidobacteraceae bacterium]|nr:1,4-alpha-glucan branching protein GlgB [Steroidobacteraceae bacterium]